MSSFGRIYVPLGLAVVFGIANGYYAFQPLLKEQHEEFGKSDLLPKSDPQSPPVSSGATSSK
ncbi:hypothetical protein GGR55DRAFT_454847 [Xylaria sp. FL0064]|nr:hypothetical protein GGR55DRAFT_454847 [Xylaria sp. FL0064]